MRRFFALFTVPAVLAASPSCGPPTEVESPHTPSPEIECPAPVGKIQREDCTAVGNEFSALSVSGAMKQAGTQGPASVRVEAIRAAAALGNLLKDKRIALCESYNACAFTPQEHAAKDKALADLMTSLVALWDSRNLAGPEDVERFNTGVRALAQKLLVQTEGPAVAPDSQTAQKSTQTLAGDQLAQIADPAITFSAASGAITVTAQPGGLRKVLRSAPALRLRQGHRYLVKVTGTYSPADKALLQAGDQVQAKVRYRTQSPTELYIALRSLEDPEATEGIHTKQLPTGDKGLFDATLTAHPGESGFYLAVGARGTGSIDLDDIELIRGGQTIASATAEEGSDKLVKTVCSTLSDQPLSGKRSLRCTAGAVDLVSIGVPTANLVLTIRSATGDRASVRTQSLDGGRSLDATLTEEGELVIAMEGAGTATIRAVEVRDLTP